MTKKESDYTFHECDSSFIKYIAHEENTLFIFFSSKSVWMYNSVPKSVFNEMAQAESTGNYFNNHVRPVYPGRNLTPISKLVLKQIESDV